jgi:hypothetical protein
MRTFSFLLEGGVTLERARHLVAPLELSRGGLEQANPNEKGRLVWWHENFVAGLDSTGFCAFSAAGVLADGVMDLDEIGARLLSEKTGSSPGEELLARGASLCLLAREVGGAAGAPPQAALAEPWAEYIALRGLDQRGEVLPEAAATVGDPAVLRWERAAALESESAPPSGPSSGRGEVSFSGTGGVERALDGRVQVSLAFPVKLEEALEVLAEEHEALRALLFVNGAAIATAWRDGERVELDEELAVGDHLDLILAVGGG